MVYVIRNGAQSFLNSLPSTIASNNFKNKTVYAILFKHKSGDCFCNVHGAVLL